MSRSSQKHERGRRLRSLAAARAPLKRRFPLASLNR
jgi:hypothetical protein